MNSRILFIMSMCCILAGCQSSVLQSAFSGNSGSATEDAVVPTMSMTQSGGEEAAHVAAINEVLDASVEEIPTISAVGYAVVSSQPGRSENQRRLMAIRSAPDSSACHLPYSHMSTSAPSKPSRIHL